MSTNITDKTQKQREDKFKAEAERLRANLRKRTEQQRKRNADRSAIKNKEA